MTELPPAAYLAAVAALAEEAGPSPRTARWARIAAEAAAPLIAAAERARAIEIAHRYLAEFLPVTAWHDFDTEIREGDTT